MSGVQAVSRRWKVGVRTVVLTVPIPKPGAQLSACAEWFPSAPVNLTADEWQQYRAGRDRALSQIAAELGITVVVLEASG